MEFMGDLKKRYEQEAIDDPRLAKLRQIYLQLDMLNLEVAKSKQSVSRGFVNLLMGVNQKTAALRNTAILVDEGNGVSTPEMVRKYKLTVRRINDIVQMRTFKENGVGK